MIIINEFVEIIKSRRSIRGYLPKPIAKEILADIIDAARLAPSANNIQPWEFIVITNKETLSKIAELATWGKFIKDAAAAVVVCGERDNPHLLEDCSAATENILLAARAYKIGSCWVAGYRRPYSEKVRSLLNIPEDHEIVSIVSLGYYYANPEPSNKRPLEKVLHWERY